MVKSVEMEKLNLECYQLERSYIKGVVAMATPELRRLVLPLCDGPMTIGFYKKLNHIVQEELNRPRQEITPPKRNRQLGLTDLTDVKKPLTKLIKTNIRTIEKLNTTKKTLGEKFDQVERLRRDVAGSKTMDKAIKVLSQALDKYRKLLDKEAKNRVLIECKVEMEEKELTAHQRRSFETMMDSLCTFVDSISELASHKPGGDAPTDQTNQNRIPLGQVKSKTKKKTVRQIRLCKVEPLLVTETLRSQVVDYDIFLASSIRKNRVIPSPVTAVTCIVVRPALSGWV